MSNDFFVKVESLQEEIIKLEKQYELVQHLQRENNIEQAKIVEQNITIRGQIEYLKGMQVQIAAKEQELLGREKQIVAREKAIITSNKLLEEKLDDFRKQMADLDIARRQFAKEKADVDKKAAVYKKLEETENTRRARLKRKEEEIDAELTRLRQM